MKLSRILPLTLCFLYSALTASGQGAHVTFGGQSKYAATKSYNKGKFAARQDLRKGRIKIKSFGYIEGYEYDYSQILKNEYKIELDWVAACVLGPSLVNEVSGYNSVMMPVIKRKFGKGVLEAAEKRAIQSNRGQQVPLEYFLNPSLPNPTIPILALPMVDLPPPPPPPPPKKEESESGIEAPANCD